MQTKMAGSRRLGFVVALTCVGCTNAESTPVDGATAIVQEELVSLLDTSEGPVPVIVNFRDTRLRPRSRDARRQENRRITDQLLDKCGSELRVSREFGHIAALAGRVSRAGLGQLQRDPNVQYIQIDEPGSGQLKEAVPAIGGDQARTIFGVTGNGIRVAVLDTGVATTHPDLQNAIVAQHCFTQGDCPPAQTTEGTSAEDDNGHGSNVAGVITSDGVVSSRGFAPNAQLVAVKINDENDSGMLSDWTAGLDWIYQNLSTLQVKVVNMSIGSDTLYASADACDRAQPAMAKAIKNLTDANVTVFASSGNKGSSTQLTSPACNTGVIAVGAVYDSNVGRQPASGTSYAARFGSGFGDCSDNTTAFDQITCFTNSNARLDILAPGAPITSDYLNGETSTFWGTSQASPVGAAVAALMLECKATLSPAEILATLKSTGIVRTDPRNNLTFPSLRALAAVQTACAGSAGASLPTGGAAGASNANSGGRGNGGASSAMGGASLPTGGAGGASGVTSGGRGNGGAATGGTNQPSGGTGHGGATSATAGTAQTNGGTSRTSMGTDQAGGGISDMTGGTSPTSGGALSPVGGASHLGESSSAGGAQNTGGSIGSPGSLPAGGLSNTSVGGTEQAADNATGCNCTLTASRSKAPAPIGALAALLVWLARRRQEFV
jgi:MYXO-CTERM domain-containing protein